MKRTSIAASALLLSTSAFAMAPAAQPASAAAVEKYPYAVTATYAVDNAYAGSSAPLYDASLDSWTADDWAVAAPAAYPAEATALTAKDKAAIADAADKAEATAAVDSDVADDADAADDGDGLDVAAEPAAMEVEPTPVAETAAMTGMGGPYEAVNPVAADLTPRAAAENYPACRPGPGDDRCIQLYEPGVREELAVWTAPTGGLAGETQVAMADDTGNLSPGEAPDDEDVGEV